MHVLGLEIRLNRKGSGDRIDNEHVSSRPTTRSYTGPTLIKRSRSGFSEVIFPTFDMNDPWEVAFMNSQMTNIEKIFSRGRVNVCAINDVMEHFSLSWTTSTRDYYNKLRTIHCVDFSLVPSEIVRQLPYIINHIFSEGRLPPVKNEEYNQILNAIEAE